MGSVGTVVVVGVKLRRRQRVGRLQLRWIGRTRRRQLCHVRTFLRGAFCIEGSCTSTQKTQTTPAAIKSVYVHSLAHPVLSKTNPASPVANHAPLVLSVTRVPPVVYLMPPVVRLVPMPMELHLVFPAKLEKKTIKLVRHRTPVAKLILVCTRNESVEIVGTVVVVGEELRRFMRA